MSVLSQNPLRQVTHHLLFVGHDPSRVPAHVLKRRHVSSVLVRHPGDMTMLHRIQQAYEVLNIIKPSFRFPSTHIRVMSFVIIIFLPRNDMSDVSYNSSLQTQKDRFISAPKYHTKNYSFTINLKKKKIIYYHKQGHVTTNGANMFAGGKIQLLVQESKSHPAP